MVIKSATYKHLMEGENSVFFVGTFPTFSVNISQNRSDYGKKSFGLFEENITYLNRLYFSINFRGDFFLNFLLKNGKRITIKIENSPFTDDIRHADFMNSVQFYLRINPYLIPKIE